MRHAKRNGLIWLSLETLRTEELYANLAIIGLMGIGFNFFLQRLSSFLAPWQTGK